MENNEVRLFPEYLELIKVGKGWEYDTIHTHEEVSEILGISYEEDRAAYYEAVSKAREEMIRLGKPLETLPSIGYRVVPPDDLHRASVGELKKTRIHNSRALLILEFGPVKEMSPLTQAAHEHYHIRTATLVAFSAKTIRDLEKRLFLPGPVERRPRLPDKTKDEERDNDRGT